MPDEPLFSTKVVGSDDGTIIYVQGEIDIATVAYATRSNRTWRHDRQSPSTSRASTSWTRRASMCSFKPEGR